MDILIFWVSIEDSQIKHSLLVLNGVVSFVEVRIGLLSGFSDEVFPGESC